jgi:CopA family copper-resistance protein
MTLCNLMNPCPAPAATTIFIGCMLTAALVCPALGRTVEYRLTINRSTVNFTGKDRPAMTINGGIPGPTLRFREGDTAVIHVHNNMDVETSLHWHGLLLPNDQDGVPYLTYPPIQAGASHTYRFPIKQSGSYWYHSHTGLQEQRGVFGSIVIDSNQDPYRNLRDEVIILSDWSDKNPDNLMRSLKRGSEWFAVKKNSAQSVLGAAQAGKLGNYFKRELSRMPPMDISDVAYDRFLANGKASSHIEASPGETLRLRLIDGSSTSYFFVEFAGGPMKIIASDGVDVQPFNEHRFLIAVAETYDVVIKVPDGGSYELRATAHDGSGHASVWIGQGQKIPAPDVPLPDLYAFKGGVSLRSMFAPTPAGGINMADQRVHAGDFDNPGMNMGQNAAHMKMNMSGQNDGMPAPHSTSSMSMPMPTSQPATTTAIDGVDPRRPWPFYAKLKALQPTNLSAGKPRRDIRLTLDGDMERYVWLLNNKTLYEHDKIVVRQGEVTRFILINRTMMHHPMHLHGHFFRVINGQGDFSPLKHTVNVAPMSTTVIEFDPNAPGDWFFHCHLLYHMHSGMARIVHYENFQPAPEVAEIRHVLLEDPWVLYAIGAGMSHMTEGNATFSNSRNVLNAYWKVGWHHIDDTEYEVDLTYAYKFNRFSSLFAGTQLTNSELGNRGIFGGTYVLPLLVGFTGWVDTEGEFRFEVDKELALTSRLSIFGEVEYDTRTKWEWQTGATFMLNENLSLISTYHSDYGVGGGLSFAF